MTADLVAESALNRELVAWLEAEADGVKDLAGDPAAFGNTGDRSEAHSGHSENDVEHGRHGSDPGNPFDVVFEAFGRRLDFDPGWNPE
ncbi:hypothetical protein D3C80_1520810 [compost metagenome]